MLLVHAELFLNNNLTNLAACYQPITPLEMYDKDGNLRTMASQH